MVRSDDPSKRGMAVGEGTLAGPYGRAAEPVRAFAQTLAYQRRVETGKEIRQASILLDRFSSALAQAGERPQSLRPARLALAFEIDQQARKNRRIDLTSWSAAARVELFDGQDMSLDRLRDFVERAGTAGPDYAAVAGFLADCLARAKDNRARSDLTVGGSWAGMTAVLVLGFLGLVAAWAAHVEWRFHRDLAGAFAAELLETGLDRDGEIPDLASRLDRLKAAEARVAAAAEKAPLTFFARIFRFDAAEAAKAAYADALQRHLQRVLARAVDAALATEGDGLRAYDTLRAWDILSRQSDWNPAWLAAWAEARPTLDAALPGLAEHIANLSPPASAPPPPDGELYDQARGFASETPEAERAWLELARSSKARELPAWRIESVVPGIGEILQRRSGLPIDQGMPGLYTAAGWAHARDVGAGLAVQAARRESVRLFGSEIGRRNDAPDLVMARLQAETLAAWRAFLKDLRVRPFNDRATALVVSGRLSARTSPLETLLRAVWDEAGGADRLRPHALQLRVATEFGPAIQYLDDGRIADISALFAALNVALGAADAGAEERLDRLMGVTDRARSIAALRQAPAIVVQIVEDVLAQTAAAQSDALSNPLTQRWQADVLPLCRAVAEGRYPFSDGPDADLVAFARLFAPGGALDRFHRSAAEPYLDTAVTPWRWKPEARFAGVSQDSAAMIQRGLGIGQGFYSAAEGGASFAVAALAERGRALVSLGGTGANVEAAGEAANLVWPGPKPEAGAEASFTTPEGAQARLVEPGPWGLFRLLDRMKLRSRDEGRRFLVDLRVEGARLFMEMTFAAPENPVAVRSLLRGFACPTAL